MIGVSLSLAVGLLLAQLSASSIIDTGGLVGHEILIQRDDDFPEASGNLTDDIFRDADEIHALVLDNIPADRIATSADMNSDEFFAKLAAAEDNSLYVSDLRTWVTLPEEMADSDSDAGAGAGELSERQVACERLWVENEVMRTHDYWGPWHAVTTCRENAGVSVSDAETLAVSFGGGIGLVIPHTILSASFGFGIEYSYQRTHTTTCNNEGINDIVQIWARSRWAWAQVRRRNCRWCIAGIPQTTCSAWSVGYNNAPASRSAIFEHAVGCSRKNKGDILKGPGRQGCYAP